MNNEVINKSIKIYQFVFHSQNIDSCYIKRFGNLSFYAKNWFAWNEKFVYVLNYSKTFKVVHKKNPRVHLSQKDKKAVMTAVAYFKVSSPVRSRVPVRSTIIAFRLSFIYQKGCFWYETEKVNTTIEFCIFELVWMPNFSLDWQFWFLDQICL